MEIISSTLLIQLLIAISISLGVVILWIFYYPQMRLRTSNTKTDKNAEFGSNEMFEQINYFNSRGNFNEGIMFAYNLLRGSLSRMEKYPNDESLTEYETIKKTVNDIPELANISNLILSAYGEYELARFRTKTDSGNLDNMNSILKNIAKNNNFILQRRIE
ncbi:MAG: hypothetical protein CMO19_00330 [Thaumarchaeota archaeon]|nr:hypothetical protein [Nitrososphaerota archaeon]|tara:strand:- start:6929 stop:7411 length:483 start_codon:yes stop_codon:yes gene_type:complete